MMIATCVGVVEPFSAAPLPFVVGRGADRDFAPRLPLVPGILIVERWRADQPPCVLPAGALRR
jgi:hypothetical protein